MKQEFVASVLNHNTPVNLPYQLVLFDFDGTLCNTESIDIYAIQKTYKALNQTIPTKEMIQAALRKGFVLESIFESLSSTASFHLMQQLLLTYKAIYRAETGSGTLFAGVTPLLNQLKKMGIISIIVSNKAIDILEASVAAMQITQYFEKIVGVREDGLYKPNPLLYERYVKPHFPMVNPHNTLMVGDTSTDLKFAKNLKIDSAWATYGLGDAENCKPLRPTYTLQQIEDLLSIVLGCER